MRSIILITDNDRILEKIENQCRDFNIKSNINSNQLNIEMEDGRIYISLSEDIAEDYEDTELDYINKLFFVKKYFYLICYSNKKMLKEMMQILTFQDVLYIDDDQGHIVPLSIFKEFLISGEQLSVFDK